MLLSVSLLFLNGCGGSSPAGLPPEEIIRANALGAAALGQQETERAVEQFRGAVEKRPDDPLLLSNLALAEMMKGEFESAEQHLRQAILLEEGYLPAHFRLGVILKNRGDLDEAIAE
jgi:Flp pilus assembly protein TadD